MTHLACSFFLIAVDVLRSQVSILPGTVQMKQAWTNADLIIFIQETGYFICIDSGSLACLDFKYREILLECQTPTPISTAVQLPTSKFRFRFRKHSFCNLMTIYVV